MGFPDVISRLVHSSIDEKPFRLILLLRFEVATASIISDIGPPFGCSLAISSNTSDIPRSPMGFLLIFLASPISKTMFKLARSLLF